MFRLLKQITEDEKDKIGLKAYNCSRLLMLEINAKEGFVIYGDMEQRDIDLIRRHAKAGVLYAVRSSMGDEDGIEYSNAGKYESVLGVKKDELVTEIECVMNNALHCVKKAVLVQELVISEVAGVMFTKNPVYKTNAMLINASLGAGENVVSSIMDADTYEVDEKEIKYYPEERRVVFTYGIDSYPGEHLCLNGIEVRTVISNDFKTIHSVFYEGTKVPVLKKEQVIKLYRIAKYLRGIFKQELDIEFAIEKNEVYILQVRPITAVNQIEKMEQENHTQDKIIGQVVSKGKFCGEALFIDIFQIDSASVIHETCKDKVLIVCELVPELLYCVDGVGAILTAKGGALSHGAIMAREKGIPCISGLGDKIYSIKTGTRLKVNADKGEICVGENNC